MWWRVSTGSQSQDRRSLVVAGGPVSKLVLLISEIGLAVLTDRIDKRNDIPTLNPSRTSEKPAGGWTRPPPCWKEPTRAPNRAYGRLGTGGRAPPANRMEGDGSVGELLEAADRFVAAAVSAACPDGDGTGSA